MNIELFESRDPVNDVTLKMLIDRMASDNSFVASMVSNDEIEISDKKNTFTTSFYFNPDGLDSNLITVQFDTEKYVVAQTVVNDKGIVTLRLYPPTELQQSILLNL